MTKRSFILTSALACMAIPVLANAPSTSLRPVLRPLPPTAATPALPSVAQVAPPPVAQTAKIEGVSKRPVMRPLMRRPAKLDGAGIQAVRFQGWVKRFATKAQRAGASDAVINSTLRDLNYLPDVVEKDRNQNEFTKTIWDYLDTAVSGQRISSGQAAITQYRRSLDAIERKYRVDREVIVAIWGLESSFGAAKGTTPVVDALATLAFDGRRQDFFESELLATLDIVALGDAQKSHLLGSWAGAMGHTQFMPSSFIEFSVDFDGDGRRDIWGNDPGDALASTAAYLNAKGWTQGQPWGIEVRLPSGFDYRQASRSIQRAPRDWQSMGVRAVDGQQIRNHGPASILLPAGHQGAAFMIFDNFAVLETYNTADAYVIGVGHLADRIAGGAPLQATWPTADRALTYDERIELQNRLNAAGFGTLKLDGLIGPLTIEAVRSYQLARGLVPDGYASLSVLNGLR